MARKKPSVRVTVYLPDELRQQASAAGLNLSALLRRAVEDELRGDKPKPEITVDRDGDVIDVRLRFAADDVKPPKR